MDWAPTQIWEIPPEPPSAETLIAVANYRVMGTAGELAYASSNALKYAYDRASDYLARAQTIDSLHSIYKMISARKSVWKYGGMFLNYLKSLSGSGPRIGADGKPIEAMVVGSVSDAPVPQPELNLAPHPGATPQAGKLMFNSVKPAENIPEVKSIDDLLAPGDDVCGLLENDKACQVNLVCPVC